MIKNTTNNRNKGIGTLATEVMVVNLVRSWQIKNAKKFVMRRKRDRKLYDS